MESEYNIFPLSNDSDSVKKERKRKKRRDNKSRNRYSTVIINAKKKGKKKEKKEKKIHKGRINNNFHHFPPASRFSRIPPPTTQSPPRFFQKLIIELNTVNGRALLIPFFPFRLFYCPGRYIYFRTREGGGGGWRSIAIWQFRERVRELIGLFNMKLIPTLGAQAIG